MARVSADADDDVVRLVVPDAGPWPAPDGFERVFHDFTWTEAPLRRTLEGIGLGAPPARKLARPAGGDVTVISTLRAGSTLTLTLPSAGPPAATDAASCPDGREEAGRA